MARGSLDGGADGTDGEKETRVSDQPTLFPLSPLPERKPGDDAGRAALEARHDGLRALAARLPDTLRMGTSSWSFPGWRGIVYATERSPRDLARDGLREYAKHPLLRTVGIDRSYYAPVPEEDLRRYASQLPDGFVCCAKAPVAVTSFTVPSQGTSIEPNPDFLSAPHFVKEMLEPFDRVFRSHTGPFLLQFPPIPPRAALDPAVFAEMLDGFLDQLPRGFEYAVELRERSLLTPAYARVLARHAVAHVNSYWSGMPMPAEQAAATDAPSTPFVVVRLLLRPFTKYAQRRQEMMPFNRIVQPDERMRRETAALLAGAARAGRRGFLLVNNKAEGSSPLTVEAIAARVAAILAESEPDAPDSGTGGHG
jgi:uncharacterized protein YecE (DUF72 family)